MLTAEATRVVAVGISRYRRPELALRYAASNAQDFGEALTAPHGCGIPTSNVVIFRDEEATSEAILRELRAAADICAGDDTLIFYFSGHGDQENGRFFLLPVEVELEDLSGTAVALESLQSALVGCRARGVLVILDCCRSAGFAEAADVFFRTLSASDFRLLLSASRAGQQSYEFDSSKGTFFTNAILDVLTGRVRVGRQSAVVYFSDLFEYVQLQVSEDLEAAGLSSQVQQPVFAGTYSRDPRLFTFQRLAVARVEAETPRYSRKFLMRRIARLSALLAACFVGVLCAYYAYLDHTRYVWHETGVVGGREGDYLAIYAGDPRLNWLGFPHRIVTTDIATSALSNPDRPGVGKPLVTPWRISIETDLYRQLSPEWQIAASVWKGDDPRNLWRRVEELNPFDRPDASGLPEATEALASTASDAEANILEDLISGDAVASSPYALRKITSLDPDTAFCLIDSKDETSSLDDDRFTIAVLEGLPGRCDSEISRFLEKTAPIADKNSYLHNAWYAAVYRTGVHFRFEPTLNA